MTVRKAARCVSESPWRVIRGSGRNFDVASDQDLTIDWRDCGQRTDLVSEFSTKLVKADIDVIYVSGAAAMVM
jgi:hypothetical protein